MHTVHDSSNMTSIIATISIILAIIIANAWIRKDKLRKEYEEGDESPRSKAAVEPALIEDDTKDKDVAENEATASAENGTEVETNIAEEAETEALEKNDEDEDDGNEDEPIVPVEDDAPVHTDSFMRQNAHLAIKLHELFEENRLYLRQSIKIDDVSSMLGTNRTYVTRLMKQEFGLTFNDYVNLARVEHSQRLLLDSDDTIENIALASGFPSSSAYCRVFKRITGTSPTTWKNAEQSYAKQ